MRRQPSCRASWRVAPITVRERHVKQAARFAGTAAGDDVGVRADAEERHQPRERRGIEPAQRLRYRLADRAENRGSQIDACEPPLQVCDDAAAAIAAVHETA